MRAQADCARGEQFFAITRVAANGIALLSHTSRGLPAWRRWRPRRRKRRWRGAEVAAARAEVAAAGAWWRWWRRGAAKAGLGARARWRPARRGGGGPLLASLAADSHILLERPELRHLRNKVAVGLARAAQLLLLLVLVVVKIVIPAACAACAKEFSFDVLGIPEPHRKLLLRVHLRTGDRR